MPDVHAKLSASGSSRWMACPGSVILEDLFEDEGSVYAEEGTNAHAVAEARLRAKFAPTDAEKQARVNALKETTSPEMWQFTGRYAEYCENIVETMQLDGHQARAYIEQRVRFDRWVPDAFGTVDFCAVGGNDLHIVDFKYGKGVPVKAEGNSQMRAYALGFLQEMECIYDNLETVTMHIVQPRINNISTETLTVKALLEWAESELKPRADRAAQATREYATGAQCKFCKAKAACRARAGYLLGKITEILGGTK